GEPEPVDGPLASGGIAVAVADERLLDLAIVDTGVIERQAPSLLCPVGIVALLGPGLVELGHADSDYERAVHPLSSSEGRPISFLHPSSTPTAIASTPRALARSIASRSPSMTACRIRSVRVSPSVSRLTIAAACGSIALAVSSKRLRSRGC